MSKKKKVAQLRISPPLVPAAELSERWGVPPLTYTLSPATDPAQALRDLVCSQVPSADIKDRRPGGFRDLLKVQANISHASHVVRRITQDLVEFAGELLFLPHVRLLVAARVLSDAMLFADAAFVLHVRSDSKPKPALVLLRSTLEVVARAALIAMGKEDEVDRFAHGTDRHHRLRSGECIRALEPIGAPVMPGVTVAPVYEWLCSFSHYDAPAVHSEPSLADVYATLAYVTTLGARVAEVLLGSSFIDKPALPNDLPWLRTLPPVPQLVLTDADARVLPAPPAPAVTPPALTTSPPSSSSPPTPASSSGA